MLNFLEPIWLWASTALIIPVIIHLWHVREGRRLKIGSVAFLEASTKQRSNNRIPRDLLLLFLRCLMILLIAFLLARPVVSSAVEKTAEGWVLFERSTMNSALAQYSSQLDSFRKAGMEFHFFEKGFPLADLSKPTGSDSSLPAIYPALASMLEEETSAETYRVFVPMLASNFRGKNPRLSKVSWYPVSLSDSTSVWIADAWKIGNDSVHIIKGKSSADKVDYSAQVIAFNGNDPEFEIINASSVRLRTQPSHEIAIGKSSMAITVISERNAPDSRYLRSALEAIATYTGRQFIITEAEPAGFSDRGSDWLFWLSTAPLPVNKAAAVFQYRAGNPITRLSWILNSHTAAGLVPLNKYIPDTAMGEKIWTDGMGNAVLSRDQRTNQIIYHFFTRFQPAWSGLPWSENFPAMMMDLILNDKDEALRMHDRRLLNQEVLSGDSTLSEKRPNAVKSTGLRDVSMNVWIALLVCFLAERMLSWYYQKTTAHGG